MNILAVFITLVSYCMAENQCEVVREPATKSPLEDFVNAVNAIVSPAFASLKSQIDQVDAKIKKSNEETKAAFDSVNSRIDSVNSRIDSLTTKLEDLMVASNYHDTKRVSTALNASNIEYICGDRVTSHSVIYRGRVATIVPRHINCSALNDNILIPHMDSVINRTILTPSDDYDVALYHNGCPSTPSALLLPEKHFPLQLGDNGIAGGYLHVDGIGKVPRIWSGTFSGNVEISVTSSTCPAFTGCALLSTDMLYFAGIQLFGMSGAPVLNHCGYSGLAVAIRSYPNYDTQYNQLFSIGSHAVVVPNYGVYKLLESNYKSLIPLENCPHLTATAIPTFPGRTC